MTRPVVISSMDRATTHLRKLSIKAGFKILECKRALIKPNVCGLYHPSIELLSCVTRYLSRYTDEIVIGETRSMIHNPETQFRRFGISRLAERLGDRVRTTDLSSERTVRVEVPEPHVLRELELPETVVKADLLVNVPKVGTHSTARITNALKNLFGLLPEKRKYSVYHPLGIDNVIADIAQVVKPDLNIADAGEKAVIGVGPLVVDVVACRFVGLNPLDVRHLRLVSEDRGTGLEDVIGNIKIVEC